MGSDIHSIVEQRILEPKFGDAKMRSMERRRAIGEIGLEEWEACHTVHWKELKLWVWEYDPETGDGSYLKLDPGIHLWEEDRSYGYFGVLAGVRDCGGWHMDGHNRGLPPETECDWDDGIFYHSITWYMCQEIVEAFLPGRLPHWYRGCKSAHNLHLMCQDLVRKYGVENVRIIFGFDS